MARFDFRGTTVVVTGASRGIGAALARRLAPEVARLVLIARSPLDLDLLADELQCPVRTLAADLSRPEDRERVWTEVESEPIDVWINNAGRGLSGRFVETDYETERTMIALNVEAPHFFMKKVLPLLIERGKGGVLNVGSTTGCQGSPFMATYGGTKSFLNFLSEGVAEELRGSAVWVSCLIPGSTDTGFFESSGISSDNLVKFFQSPDEVAATALRGVRRGKVWIVSGWLNRLMLFGERIFSRGFVSRCARRTLGGLADDAAR